jgi:hypothetical protein
MRLGEALVGTPRSLEVEGQSGPLEGAVQALTTFAGRHCEGEARGVQGPDPLGRTGEKGQLMVTSEIVVAVALG